VIFLIDLMKIIVDLLSNMYLSQDFELNNKPFNTKKYQQVIGSVLYLAICTKSNNYLFCY